MSAVELKDQTTAGHLFRHLHACADTYLGEEFSRVLRVGLLVGAKDTGHVNCPVTYSVSCAGSPLLHLHLPW